METVLTNRQRRVRVNAAWLRRFAKAALEECVHESGDGMYALKQAPVVEIAIVTDDVISRVHEDFMDIPGATDVITFEHGEIVASAETAARYAEEHGHTVDEELALYIVHGMLHLNGHDDMEPHAHKKMHQAQDRIWKKVIRSVGGSPVQK